MEKKFLSLIGICCFCCLIQISPSEVANAVPPGTYYCPKWYNGKPFYYVWHIPSSTSAFTCAYCEYVGGDGSCGGESQYGMALNSNCTIGSTGNCTSWQNPSACHIVCPSSRVGKH